MERVLKFLTRRGNVFTILTLIGVAVGLGLGIGLRNSNGEAWTKRDAMYLRLPGDLFLRCLSGIMLPLIISSLVSATGSLDLSVSKKIGSRALVYYLSTSAIAAILGSAMVHFISPGTRSDDQNSEDCGGEGGSTIDTILDLLRNVFPPNIIAATHQNTRTEVTQNASIRKQNNWTSFSLIILIQFNFNFNSMRVFISHRTIIFSKLLILRSNEVKTFRK